MRYAVLADIHANYKALEAVLDDIAAKGGVDEVWCLGDIVGYGPEPAECIKLLQMVNPLCVSGNHDLGAAGKMDLTLFNPLAAEACKWTAEKLNPVDIRYLAELPLKLKKGDFTLVHGSPRDPSLEYVLSAVIAERNFEFFDTQYCLAGHTHIPAAYKLENTAAAPVKLRDGIGLVMTKHRIIINPGAVGQPRDGDPRASYGIYDSGGQIFRLYRVEYDFHATQDKMMEAGLPIQLVARLGEGK
jgi:predicted phosphodiesterase